MGLKYTWFRTIYEIKRKTGLLRSSYPVNPPQTEFLSLSQWKNSSQKFLFDDPNDLNIPKGDMNQLLVRVRNIKQGVFKLFHGIDVDMSQSRDWVTNPMTGFKYDSNSHWTEIPTFNKTHGDIKYVWERSRFCYLFDLIRYDAHTGTDQSDLVFSEILSWIEANPINCGPNYTCSQEMSLRCFNWLFAMNYYKHSQNLTERVFQQIIHHIFWQISHVWSNIQFSRIAVRNNHTLTETLALFVFGTLFPEFDNAKKWKDNGKRWFEEEIDYQIYDDGTFLQYSMNYNRVVVQLITWALIIARKNKNDFSGNLYEKTAKTLDFLIKSMDNQSGCLPNYGANDGALFFKLNDADYRDYRPQLNVLFYLLNECSIFTDANSVEELSWYGLDHQKVLDKTVTDYGIFKYEVSGYYIIREQSFLTFIRCGDHLNRPSQADNHHLDIWHEGQNIMRDLGSFEYNNQYGLQEFFVGTGAHNTISVNDLDQMKKGPHFIWLDWTHSSIATMEEENDCFIFTGVIHAFKHSGFKINHKRKLTKYKSKAHWVIEDHISGMDTVQMKQVWNPISDFDSKYTIVCKDRFGSNVEREIHESWYSTTYGVKEKCMQFQFNHVGNYLQTEISLK